MSTENKSRPGRKTRPYQKKERARQQEETRRRITEAVVELHKTVGPARTTVSEVAELAGVGRMTVYKHFPTEVSMFAACSNHWANENPMPDFTGDIAIKDFGARLEAVLERLYAYFESNRQMLGNIMKDAPSMPPLQEVLDEGWNSMLQSLAEQLLPSGLKAKAQKQVRVVLSLALDYRNWEVLAREGLSAKSAARLAARMVLSAMPEISKR